MEIIRWDSRIEGTKGVIWFDLGDLAQICARFWIDGVCRIERKLREWGKRAACHVEE